MVLTRAQNQPGQDNVLGTADDIQDANNTDSPWVDQSQTYTSHSSHQVFLREYVNNSAGRPVSTGKLLGGLPAGETYFGSPDGTDGISTWASVKKQAHDLLGIKLTDMDVLNVPMLATDPYGQFIPGANGLPQFVTETGLVPARLDDPATPADETAEVPANVLHFDTPFLTDIAHNADPSPRDTDNNPATDPVIPTPDADNTPSADFAHQPVNTYDDEMLDAHFSCGDGRCNENIGLSTIHQIFHSEHDRLVDDIKKTLNDNPDLLAAYQAGHPFGADNEDISFGFGCAAVPGRAVRHRDGVPAPGVRGVRSQGPARDQPLRAVRVHPDGAQPGHQGRVRARRLPLRPLDAHRHDLPAQRGPARPRHRVRHGRRPPREPERHLAAGGLPQPAGVLRRWVGGNAHPEGGCRQRHHGHVGPDR